MMKKIIFILLGLQLAIIANSQISQDSALAIMKNHINNYNDCDIYVANNTIGIGELVLRDLYSRRLEYKDFQSAKLKPCFIPSTNCTFFFNIRKQSLYLRHTN